MSIVVIGAVFVDIKGYPYATYLPGGRNQGRIETTHGGVSRNIAEDVANLHLPVTFLSLTDDSALGKEVIEKLYERHVNTNYIRKTPDGMGTWLAVFDHNGDVVASISKRPDLRPLLYVLRENGDRIFSNASSILLEIDLDREISEEIFRYAALYHVPVYAAVSNMSIALDRRDLIKATECFVCNVSEAEILFSENYEGKTPEEMQAILEDRITKARIRRMVVTMGAEGAVYAECGGECGIIPGIRTVVRDTTGAGDAFFAGTAVGLTCHKTLKEACEIGTRLASSVIESQESVCPEFLPEELGLSL
ncbi:MAG: carbohydrate kinase family protein [Lachnospiraceae bacterium]|nr:carbohydrate kinase family protein [Lachnospiraceae bacterium]